MLITFVLFANDILAQHLEVEGKAIIKVMEQDSFENSIVVQQTDGTLAIKEQSLITGLEVGDYYEGGIVFFTYDNGKHGLLASVDKN